MFNVLADGMVITGACILGSALLPVSRLVVQLPHGPLHKRWCILCALIIIFIAGYLGYVIIFWLKYKGWYDLIVPAIFFFGAAFVWMTTTSALQTVMDIRRLSLLEQETITDSLIGIYNRRYLDHRLAEEFSKARRYATTLSVMMLDIDGFKPINDTFGHQVGDLVLRHLGKQVLSTIRKSDIAGRYGGDELAIISPNTPVTEAAILAERLRQYVETHPLILAGEQNQPREINMTISIGVAALGMDFEDSDTLLRNADLALYRAKQKGHNCVEVCDGNPIVKGAQVLKVDDG